MVEHIRELDGVVLLEDVPSDRLEAGMTGTVVDVYGDGEAYAVEFVAKNGHTFALPTLKRHQLLPLREVPAEAA